MAALPSEGSGRIVLSLCQHQVDTKQRGCLEHYRVRPYLAASVNSLESQCVLKKQAVDVGIPNFRRCLNIWIATFILGTLESNTAESHRMSGKFNLDAMSIDEMWQLHEEVNSVLSTRLTSEKRELEKRLAQLRREKEMRQSEAVDSRAKGTTRERRKYPRVSAKYRNPNEPSETWSGRGKQPRWLTAALKTGHTIDEFVIRNGESSKNNFRR